MAGRTLAPFFHGNVCLVSMPANQGFTAFMALGVFIPCTRYISDIDVEQTRLFPDAISLFKGGNRGRFPVGHPVTGMKP